MPCRFGQLFGAVPLPLITFGGSNASQTGVVPTVFLCSQFRQPCEWLCLMRNILFGFNQPPPYSLTLLYRRHPAYPQLSPDTSFSRVQDVCEQCGGGFEPHHTQLAHVPLILLPVRTQQILTAPLLHAASTHSATASYSTYY